MMRRAGGMMQTRTLNPLDYYRLPWSLNDNVLGWLEPTKRCNLACEGCYSRNDPKSDKSLDQVRKDLELLVGKRRVDSISIAGGDPLVHPDIVEIVRIIREQYGLKPVVNTNGLALTPELLKRLKRAGVHGFTFHIDTTQHRPNWRTETEAELNPLREQYARMVAGEGGLSVAFNATITRATHHEVPSLMEWARKHIDIVHSMVFILFRTSRAMDFEYYAHGKRVDVADLVYLGQDENPEPLTARDLVATIRGSEPEYEPAAYLGGTKDPSSFKWLLAGRIGTKDTIYGYVGKRSMELFQTTHHLLTGRYLGYSKPSLLAWGRSMVLGLFAIDPSVRRVAGRYARRVLRTPQALLQPLYFQSILIIQPIDTLSDGTQDMCDGCPDITVHDGELVWSCRLDEKLQYGCFLSAVPKQVPDRARHLPTLGNPQQPSAGPQVDLG